MIVKKNIAYLVLIILTIFLLFYNLDYFPPLWWDEGWTLSVARNWIENGHFGHYLDGEKIPPRIPVRFPVVIPIALSFRLFGVGTWQGRLPGVIFTFFTLVFMFYLTLKLYNHRVAFGSIFILYCMSPFFIHPLILIGRQVLAEMPMLFYLLGGYVWLWAALTRSSRWILLVALFWGIALQSKIQVPLFWIISIGFTLFFTIKKKYWIKARIIGTGVFGALVVTALLLWVRRFIVHPYPVEKQLIELLINSVVIVLNWSVRSQAIMIVITFCFPVILGYWNTGWRILTNIEIINWRKIIKYSGSHIIPELGCHLDENRNVIEVALWSLGASWFAWYVFFGMYWPRYVYPAFFIGSIFASFYLDELTSGFNIRVTVLRISSMILHKQLMLANLKALIGVLIIGVSIGLGVVTILNSDETYFSNYQEQVMNYIQDDIPDNALIETFESELFFLAPHRYHFPSDLVSMQLVRRETIDPTTSVIYDPLEVDVDYLIVGNHNRIWHLYDEVLASGAFQLVKEFPGYQIYLKINK